MTHKYIFHCRPWLTDPYRVWAEITTDENYRGTFVVSRELKKDASIGEALAVMQEVLHEFQKYLLGLDYVP